MAVHTAERCSPLSGSSTRIIILQWFAFNRQSLFSWSHYVHSSFLPINVFIMWRMKSQKMVLITFLSPFFSPCSTWPKSNQEKKNHEHEQCGNEFASFCLPNKSAALIWRHQKKVFLFSRRIVWLFCLFIPLFLILFHLLNFLLSNPMLRRIGLMLLTAGVNFYL